MLSVAKCPAARQGLECTKCLAVRNFPRISTESFLSNFLMVFDVSLEMQSNSEHYVRLQEDKITKLVQVYKIGMCLTLLRLYRQLKIFT